MAKKIKVFEVTECGSPHGVGRQMAAICGHLNPEKFELWVIYSVRPGCTPEEFEKMTPQAHRCVYIPEMVREIRPLKDLAAFWKLYRLMKKEKPEVVHAHSSKAGVLARCAAWAAGVPRIYYTPHGYGFLQTNVGKLSRGLYWLIEKTFSWIGNIVSTAHGEAARARELSWGKEVFVVYNLFLMEDVSFPVSEKKDRVSVGALGRITHARNPDAFLRLAEALAKKYPSVKILWMGGGELEEPLRAKVTQAGLSDRFELTGHIDREAVLKNLSRLDIFVHYSLWEGSPTSILEAMFFSKPVVASRISGNEDLVEDGVTGYLVGDEAELLQRVGRLVESVELRASMGKKGKERLENEFSLKKSVAALESLYQYGTLKS